MIETVEAEVIGEAASPSDIIRFNAEELAQTVLDMSAMLEKAQAKIEFYDISDEQIQNERISDLKTYRADINATIAAYDDARKEFKRKLMAPYTEAEAKGKEAIEPLKSILERIKREIDCRAERDRTERYNALRDAYEAYAGLLVGVVPFDRILAVNEDRKWLLKSTKPEKAINELEQFVCKLSDDWQRLKKATLHYPDETEAAFFRTLDLGDALAHDQERFEEQQRIEAMKEAQRAYAPEPEPEHVRVYDVPRERTVEPQTAGDAPTEDGQRYIWVCIFEGTKAERDALVNSLRVYGIHGRIKASSYGSVEEVAGRV